MGLNFVDIDLYAPATERPTETELITREAIARDPAWEVEERRDWLDGQTSVWDTEIYSRLDAPISIDFGSVAHRPGVPYLTNGVEPVELGGLTTMAQLNAFIAGFNRRKVTPA